MPKPSERSRDSQAAQESWEQKKKKKKLLCFSNGWFKAYKTQSHFPAQQPQLETLQLERGSRAAGEEAAGSAQPIHRTRAPGDAALSLGGAELVPGLSPARSAEP